MRGDDAYLSLLSLDENGAVLHVYRYPWLSLIWLGGLTCAAGGALSVGLRFWRRRAERSTMAAVLAPAPIDPDPLDPEPVDPEPIDAGPA